MTAIIRALSLLIFFSQLLHAAPVEPPTANIKVPAFNSDDPSRQFLPENELNPSSENEKQKNTYPDPDGEPQDNWFPPGISLSHCEGSFDFSVKTPDSSLNSTPLFPYSNDSGQYFDVLYGGGRGHVLSCKSNPNDREEGEMKVSCRCGRVHRSLFNTISLWTLGFLLICCICDKIFEPRGRDESARNKNGRNGHNIVRQPRVSQKGSEMEMEGNDSVETVVVDDDDEISEDFDDSNYPMG